MAGTKYNRRKNKTAKRQNRKTIRGGNGASTFGEYAFGSAGSQTSVDGPSNLISTNSADKYMANPDTYAYKNVTDGVVGGGNKKQQGGRGILTDIAIPAVLLYANNTIGKKNKSRKPKKSRKKRLRFSRKKK